MITAVHNTLLPVDSRLRNTLTMAQNADDQGNDYYGMAVGFTVMAGAFAVGNVSRAAFAVQEPAE